MAWKAAITGKSRDGDGRLSLAVEYRDTVTNVKQDSKTFLFERGTAKPLVQAQIRSYGLVAFVLRTVDDALDSGFQIGDEIVL